MSTNAAFAGPVPESGIEQVAAPSGARPAAVEPSGGIPASAKPGPAQEPAASAGGGGRGGELERWYVEQRAWPVWRDGADRLWLEAGTEFDVVEVPEEAGRRALRRLIGYGQAALAPGPVALSEKPRCWFFVAPGARDDLPELLDWLDWGGIDLDMQAYGLGDRIPAPARDGWLHDPLAVPPEVIALLATIAQSCSRYALSRRAL